MSHHVTLGWPTRIGVVVDDLDRQRGFWGCQLGLPEDHSTEHAVTFKMPDGRWFELIERQSDPAFDESRFKSPSQSTI
jgi:hypothetical protein